MRLIGEGVEISAVDFLALEYAIADPEAWIISMIQSKINSSRKRMRKEWVDKLIDDTTFTTALPSEEDALLVLISGRPDYKKRADRPDTRPRI